MHTHNTWAPAWKEIFSSPVGHSIIAKGRELAGNVPAIPEQGIFLVISWDGIPRASIQELPPLQEKKAEG